MSRITQTLRYGLPALLWALPQAGLAKGSSESKSPPAASRTVMVFVGADDKGAESSALRLGAMVEDALGRFDKYNFTPLRDAAGERVPADARAALHTAEDDLSAGKKNFIDGKLEDAEASLKSAIKGFEAGAAGLEKPDEYCDAWAYLGAVYQLKHKDDDAKDNLAQALAVEPGYKLDAKLGASPVADLMRQVRRESGEGHKGSISLFSTPAGGRAYLDGELKGFAPLSVDRIPVGRHLVRFERPGYMNVGQVVEIASTDESAVKAHFQATKDFSDVEDQVGQALKEVDSSSCGPSTFRLLKHYTLDRAIFANVRTTGDNLVLDLALVDAAAKKRVAHRRNSFEGEDPQNLTREVNKLVAGLIADAEDRPKDPKASASKDPLDKVDGMEDWDEDKGNSRGSGGDDDDSPKKKKKKSSNDDE
ncbi:MAG: PEGA domain-containing protein [Deltaproteobacteria bacterium]|nr:PEGA domain-containing protein [Deltaproteobacteria bacterium]